MASACLFLWGSFAMTPHLPRSFSAVINESLKHNLLHQGTDAALLPTSHSVGGSEVEFQHYMSPEQCWGWAMVVPDTAGSSHGIIRPSSSPPNITEVQSPPPEIK